MRKHVAVALAVLTAVPAFAVEDQKSEERNTFYAVGQVMARQLTVFDLSAEEFEQVKKGLEDGIAGTAPRVDLETYKQKIQQLALERRNAQGEKLAARSKEYIERAAKEKGALKTPSGLVYKSLREGTGASPTAADTVKVHYRGTLIDGREFDSSYAAGKPAEFRLDQVIKCWTEGVPRMKAGGKARLICPPDIAYGERGSGIIPANATLVFEVELLEVVK